MCRPTSTGHTLLVTCGLTQILAEGPGCRLLKMLDFLTEMSRDFFVESSIATVR